jgi:hypothetical protein
LSDVGRSVDGDLRLADLLAALSMATDLGMGHEPEKAVRACVLATELARSADLSEVQVRDVYYTTMLQHLGCTAPAHATTQLVGDERAFLSKAERTDETSLRESLELLSLVGRGTGVRRLQYLARMMGSGKQATADILQSTCEVGSRMAERLHLGDGVTAALRDITEVWNGSGGANHHSGDDIPVAARFALVATQAVLFDRLGGPEAAIQVVQDRAGLWFDPDIADTFVRDGEDGRFANISDPLGLAIQIPTRGVAFGDATGDGRLDMAIARQWDESVFYHNASPDPGAHLNLRLLHESPSGGVDPDPPDPEPVMRSPVVGAQVTVTTPDGRTLTGHVDGGSGHSGKRSHEVAIGLGDVREPMSVRIAWRDRSGEVREGEIELTPGTHTLRLGSEIREETS